MSETTLTDPIVGSLILEVDDQCGTPSTWRGEFSTLTGIVHVWIELPNEDVGPPAQSQIDLLHHTLENLDECKKVAVAYVHNEVLSNPDHYGVLDDDGQPYSVDMHGPIQWATASLAEYLNEFRGRQVGIPANEADGTVYIDFETELDIEHGVTVELVNGVPTRIGMTCDFGQMLVL